MSKKKKNATKKPIKAGYNFKIRMFFSISIFIIIVVSGIISTAGIAIMQSSGLFRSLKDEYAPLMIAMAFSVIIGGIITFIWTHIILIPVCTFIDATKKIAEGNYDVRINFEKLPKRLLGLPLSNMEESFNNMADELSSTEIFRKDFISNFSHEFKTPIMSICGFAEQIYEGGLTDEEQSEFARIIMEESKRLANMSSNVLLLTKLESQEVVSDKSEFYLDEQIRNSMILFEDKWSRKNIDIDMDLERISYVQNREMVSMVWNNLISNAVKYTPENGSIMVRCHKDTENNEIIVSVKDSGIGMDEETAKRIFDKFYQRDSSHSAEGNGLGLAIVKQILILIDGYISLNTKPGGGSEFIVHLKI